MSGAVKVISWQNMSKSIVITWNAYKEYQRKGYQRDPDDPCQELRNRIAYLERLIGDRSMHDARFPNPGFLFGRHADVNAAANYSRVKSNLHDTVY